MSGDMKDLAKTWVSGGNEALRKKQEEQQGGGDTPHKEEPQVQPRQRSKDVVVHEPMKHINHALSEADIKRAKRLMLGRKKRKESTDLLQFRVPSDWKGVFDMMCVMEGVSKQQALLRMFAVYIGMDQNIKDDEETED